MATPLHGRDRATRVLLIALCLFAFGPIMVAALLKIVGIETRNGYRSLKSLVQTRAHPGDPFPRGSSDRGEQQAEVLSRSRELSRRPRL